MKAVPETCDIAIAGAGLIGLPLAIVLARQGWQVVLLDERPGVLPEWSDDESEQHELEQRCTALSLGSRLWFEANDLWSHIEHDACLIRDVHVSHKGCFGATRLQAAELNVQAVGYVVNNDALLAALSACLPDENVRHIHDARVQAVTYTSNAAQVRYSGGTVSARLVIATDGVSSVVRECTGVGVRHTDYDQSAALTTVRLDRHHEHIAYERFTDSGPLALLPRPGQCMSVVDCFEPDDHAAIESMTDAEYLQRLQQRFGYRLGVFQAVGPRFITPLIRIEAERQIASRSVFLGNAARLLHPVGGQGYNLALRDLAALQQALGALSQRPGLPPIAAASSGAAFEAESLSSRPDPGESALLEAFAQSRHKDQQQIVWFSDTLARGFRGRSALVSHIRALGLLSLDTLPPLRRTFARRTMGLM